MLAALDAHSLASLFRAAERWHSGLGTHRRAHLPRAPARTQWHGRTRKGAPRALKGAAQQRRSGAPPLIALARILRRGARGTTVTGKRRLSVQACRRLLEGRHAILD